MVKILADFHHADLFEAHQLLFTDRFGWDVFMPIGMEYWQQDYWVHERAWHGDAIAKQYLSLWNTDRDCGDHWEREDWQHPGRVLKMLTLEQARAMRPEIVLCSLLHNEPGYYKLAKELGAKYGLHTGNQGTDDHYEWADFCLFSTTRQTLPNCPYCFYHQEFNVKDQYTFHYPPEEKDTVCTFVQVLYASSGEQDRFDRLAKATPELRWYTHGHDDRNPYFRANIKNTPLLAKTMQACRVGAHFKTWSDGYGHVIYSLFAIGRPVVCTASYYLGKSHDHFPKLAGELMEDGVTCFDVQAHTDAEAVEFIRRLVNDEDYYFQFSERVYNRFCQCVDFEEDAAKIKAMLEQVL
jgi:hypothetical protein